MTSPLRLSQFDYVLPPELIAQSPPAQRSASRLLHLDRRGRLHDRAFPDLPGLLRPHDVLVFNDTRVIKARLLGTKESGGKVEVLVERISGECTALAHIRSSRAPRAGSRLVIEESLAVDVRGRSGELFDLHFPLPVLAALEQHGRTPLPPYIERTADAGDADRYQTVYARAPGAVAAPTAGLHFDQAMMEHLKSMGLSLGFVTLHVGAGTFQPVRVENLDEHIMHSEHFEVPLATRELVRAARDRGGRVIAVGTTSVRALESAFGPSGTATPPESGDTRLFIKPGYRFHCVDALITNFHLPQSTLLMLVSALAGMEPIRRAYAHAIAQRYRFFSYGDAMFIEAPGP